MIVGYVRAAQLEWREPDDEEVVEPHPAPSPAPSPPPSAAQERPDAPLPRSLLDTLPPAGMQPPPSALPSTAAAANSTPVSSYVGERPVDPTWLAARETTLAAVRADYEAARARAQTNGGTGPGWSVAALVTDDNGQTHSASGAPLLHITDPNAAPLRVGWDEGGPVYQPDPGTWLEFDEAAFAAAYRVQGGAPLQALAAQYGTDAATVFAQHPDLWAVATTDHALNAGPAPAGVAMGNASQLGMLDLYLADPQIASLVQTYGGTVAPATGGIAQEQVRLYGQARYEQLSRLGNAMQSVRAQYTTALTQGFISGSGPGWVERDVTTYVTDESGQQIGSTSSQRRFDPDAFTAWYVKQDGLQNKAFLDFYGASHTSFTTDELGHRVPGSVTFDNPHWNLSEVSGVGYPMTHGELVSIDPNSPPDLNNDQAVGFDLEAGWATSQANLHQDTDWFEIVVKVAIVAVVSYVSAGTLGPEVAGAFGATTTAGAAGSVTLASGVTLSATGVVVSAAVAGAATSVVSGIVNDNLTFKSILQGALAGALTAGLTGAGTDLGKAASGFGPVGTIALNTTVQGGIQALLGGRFKDGAIAGFASGLASLAGAGIGKGIDDAVKAGSMSTAEAMAARSLARVFTSAVQALGNPNDPSYGFASALVNGVVGQVVQPAPVAAATAPAATPAAPAPAPAAEAEAPPAEEVALPATAPAPAPATPVPAPAPAAEAPPIDEAAPVAAPTEPGQPATSEPSAPFWIWNAANGRSVLGTEDAAPTGALRPIEGDQPAFPNPELVPSGASVTALVDDAGRLWFHIVAEGVDRTVAVGEVTTFAPVTVTGSREGSAQAGAEVSAAMAAAAAGGRVLTGEELLALGSKAFGRALSGLGELVKLWPELTLKAAGIGLYLLTFSSAAGGASEQVQISDDQRFVKSHDMPFGSLQRRDANGDWKTVVSNVQLMPLQLGGDQRFVTGPDGVHGDLLQRYETGDWRTIKADVQLVQFGTQRAALTDAEIRAINAPMVNPSDPKPNPPLITPVPTNGERSQPLPGYEGQPPAGPTITTTPIETQTWDELLIERNNSEILGGNLRAAGDYPPAYGYEAHHMVPSEAGGPAMDQLRSKLQALGLDLNQAANGVWLPGWRSADGSPGAYHQRLNNDVYDKAIEVAFAEVTTLDRALEVLADIKQQLKDGTFPGVRPRP